ncbi:uncharacterized protein LACBIDRAFT_330220 [Laccaria bicolor S238N-H82]|uniref:Predicted protein n=1 Tax=Laccaria bicolor (strain S238N-H82 / ATCC MYA-4686) TaxID=486041 RepID=B0DJZ1_LACBS|nr:uncharacterized protein LACBIDRAFT_330220 [Laccaria bicolor S238N-H82]EDR04981.1 predicted protein [Laccaria bicolor S238N-H82]|eukprot:XP_001884371.1 predicted protein [Laccaria bicolor S238N-H82]
MVKSKILARRQWNHENQPHVKLPGETSGGQLTRPGCGRPKVPIFWFRLCNFVTIPPLCQESGKCICDTERKVPHMSHPMASSITPRYSYPAGSHITLCLTDGTSLSLQVNKPFLPFTKSQVYLASPSEPSTHNLPTQIILKIFYPQTVDNRFPPLQTMLPAHPWPLDAKAAAVQYREDIVQGKCLDDFMVGLLYGEQEAEVYLWEEHFYRLLKESYESEVGALARLESLQGTVVPNVFGMGSIILLPNTRAIQPLGVLIEYVPGILLSKVKPGSGVNIPFEIVHPLIDAMKKFKDIGVRDEGCGDEDWEMNYLRLSRGIAYD